MKNTTEVNLADLLDSTSWMRSPWKSGDADNGSKRKLSAVVVSDENVTGSSTNEDDSGSSSSSSSMNRSLVSSQYKHCRRKQKKHKHTKPIVEPKSTESSTDLVNWARKVHGDSLKIKDRSTQLVKDFDLRAKSFIEFVGNWSAKQGESEAALNEARVQMMQSFQVINSNISLHRVCRFITFSNIDTIF